MYSNLNFGKPHFGPDYVPYFYASGRFVRYDLPHVHAPLEFGSVPQSHYDFTSDLLQRNAYPVPQTVEQIIRRGYLAIPRAEPETAIISDKKDTSRLGLEDVIGQIRKRYELYDKNINEIEIGK